MIDLVGQSFGRWIVLHEVDRVLEGKLLVRAYKCRCSCGNTSVITVKRLRSGRTNSCGCLRMDSYTKGKTRRTVRWFFLTYKKQASKRGLCWEITEKEFLELVVKPCCYCGALPKERVHKPNKHGCVVNGIDRVDNSKGYSLSNCVPCCALCNKMKNNLSVEQFLGHLKKVLNYLT